MYDASGIRFHTGRQAALLNQIVSDFPPEHPIISSFRPLQEPLGHSPFQVTLPCLFYSVGAVKILDALELFTS
jgi:acid phosphatase family membrane protein YuiD